MWLRDLTPADLIELEEGRGSHLPTIARLRDSHHRLAMYMAEGMSIQLAAQMAGYSVARASGLRGDPSFIGLIEHYRTTKARDEAADLGAKMRALGEDLVDELRERLETNPDQFETKDIIDGISKFADRTGHGPQTKNTNVNVHIGLAEALEAARQRRKPATIPALAELERGE